MKNLFFIIFILVVFAACENAETTQNITQETTPTPEVIQPKFITDTTRHDTDDPAIWVHPTDVSKSLIVGTDKNEDGALYIFNLEGKIINRVGGLQRPNNVDIEYGLPFGNDTIDIAVATERLTHKLRVFKLPEMTEIDSGGIEIFKGETGEDFRALMGIALYKNLENGKIYAIAGRKNGPVEGYLWQYELFSKDGKTVEGNLVRKFGNYSQKNEIEAIAADNQMGFIYYSDEGYGIRKYYANPEKGNEEIAIFGQEGFAEDHEGISIYPTSDTTGYILVSDQQADHFRIYKREGDNEFIKTLPFATRESDGSDCSPVAFDNFKKGIFVAMSEGKTFHIYDWETIEKRINSNH